MSRLIDDSLPVYHVVERHQIEILAPAERVYKVVRHLDFGGSALIRLLFWLRELPGRLHGSGAGSGLGRRDLTLDALVEDGGFVLLGERANEEILLGLVGRFWTFSGGTQLVGVDDFREFSEPRHAKAVWNFVVVGQAENRTLLSTETRVFCLDKTSKLLFRAYWTLVGPFSGLIRQDMLRAVKRQADVP